MIFGPSKAELQEQIDEIKEDLSKERGRRQGAMRAARTADAAAQKAQQDVEELQENLEQAQRTLDPNYADDDEMVERDPGTTKQIYDSKTVWKRLNGDYVAKLYIPMGATVVQPEDMFQGKSRTDIAIVGGIYDENQFRFETDKLFGDIDDARSSAWVGESWWDSDFEYTVGDIVEPEEEFDDDPTSACESGIHFYINKQDV